MHEWQQENKDASPATLLGVRLLAPGEERSANAEFDPSRAAEEYAAMLRRTGQQPD